MMGNLGMTLLQMFSNLTLPDYVTSHHPIRTDPVDIYDRPFQREYDYIIVGAGSAGSVIASRVSEDPVSVLLLEAGKSDLQTEFTQIPLMWLAVIGTDLDWKYYTTTQKYSNLAMKNEQSYWARGKCLGGTSSMNVMDMMRGSRHDYDQWKKDGCTDWGYDDVLPFFKKMENMTIPHLKNKESHGKDGPLTIGSGTTSPLYFIHEKAAEEVNLQVVDCNSGNQIGFCHIQSNIKNGERDSTFNSYVRPVLSRPNLQVNTNSHVIKVLILNGVAHGVEVVKDGVKSHIYAKKEVVLSAGFIGSAQILLLSGIGPKQQLKKFNIYNHVDLPVGQNLQDHVLLSLQYNTNISLNVNSDKMHDPERILNYILNREGIFSKPGNDGQIFIRLKEESEVKNPDVQVTIAASSYEEGAIKSNFYNFKEEVVKEHLKRSAPNGFVLRFFLLHPASIGTLELQSNDPFVQPVMDPRYLTQKVDVDTLLKAIRFGQSLERALAWRSIGATFVRHDMDGHCSNEVYDSDQYWICIIQNFATGGSHQTSTCRMGSPKDPTTVVDQELRVLGVQNVRVADASVMRNTPSGNPNAPIIMIAEKAADLIRKERKLKSKNQKMEL